MERLANIIVGYDFSEQSRVAIKTATRLAKAYEARLIVVTSLHGHIDKDVLHSIQVEAAARTGRTDLFDTEKLLSSAEARVRAELDTLELGEVPLRVEVGLDRPWELLLEGADNYEADLIVVGATGLGTVERWLVGSTSERLVRVSRWPVLVAREDRPIESLLCAVDFSDASKVALGWAATLARTFDATLHIMHAVVTEPTFAANEYFDYTTYRTAAIQRAQAQFDEFLEGVDLKGVTWERHLRTTSAEASLPDTLIVATAVEVKADLLCMGSLGRTGLRAVLIGNTAERVLRRLPCSLMTIKPDDFSLKSQR